MKDLLHHLEAASRVAPADMQEGKSQRRDRRYQRLTLRNEVIAAVRDWWQARLSGDVGALGTLTCERYMEFAGDGEVTIAGRTALMERARDTSGSSKISEWAIMKPEVRRLEDAAVCNYHFQTTGSLGHKSFRMEGLFTDVLIRFGDRWKLVARHLNFPTALDSVSQTANPGTGAKATELPTATFSSNRVNRLAGDSCSRC